MIHSNFLLGEKVKVSQADLPSRKYEKAWLALAAEIGIEEAIPKKGFKTVDDYSKAQKILLYKQYIKYIKYLQSGSDIPCITSWDKKLYKGMITALKKDDKIMELIHGEVFGNVLREKERKYYVEVPYRDEIFTLAVVLDDMVIDHDSKTRKINDLKTSYKLEKFQESIEKYDYGTQGALYKYGLDLLFPETKDYKTEVNLVVVDKSREYKTDIIQLTDRQLEDGEATYCEYFKLVYDIINGYTYGSFQENPIF